MTKPYLLLPSALIALIANSQTAKYNYDKYGMGFISHTTFYQPKSFNTSTTFIYDRGNLAGDWSAFYAWKKRSVHTVFAGMQTRLSEFKDSISFQSKDKFIEVGFLIGKRMYIVDHCLFADFNMGTSIRKLLNRRYLLKPEDENLRNRFPKNSSFTNSITGSLLLDLRLNFEFIKATGILFVGLGGSNDIYQFGNSNFNRFSNKFGTISLNFGFTAIL